VREEALLAPLALPACPCWPRACPCPDRRPAAPASV